MKSVSLLDDFAGRVENFQELAVTNLSASLTWSALLQSNGIISGYSLYVNDSTVSIYTIMTFILNPVFICRY